MLRADAAPDQREIGAWTAKLVSECRDLLSALLPLEENEREFVARLRWKAINVRHHRGIPLEGIEDEMA